MLLAYERQTRWFQLEEGAYELIEPGADGILRSQVFPGLWFASERFWADDLAGLLDALKVGLATDAHQAFAARMQ